MQAVLFWVAVLALSVHAITTYAWYRWYFVAYNVVVLVLNLGFKVTFDQVETQLGLRQAGAKKQS